MDANPSYYSAMKSIADSLREENGHSLAGLSAGQRGGIALRLGDQAVHLHASYKGVSEQEARRRLRRQNTRGRRRSTVVAELNS